MANVNFENTVTQYPVANLAALKAINTTSVNTGIMVMVSTLGWFRLDKSSSATANDDNIVQPTSGGGRWLRITPLLDSVYGTAGFKVQLNSGSVANRSLIGSVDINIVNSTGSGGDAQFTLSDIGTPGTYFGSFAVDAKGRVVNATNNMPFDAAPSTITATTTLSNPANAYYFVDMSADNQQINLMAMNETDSPKEGSFFRLSNSFAGKAFDVYYNDGATFIYLGVQPGQSIIFSPVGSASANGAVDIILIAPVSNSMDTTASGIWASTPAVTFKYNFDNNTVTFTLPDTFATANTPAKITFADNLPSFLRPIETITDVIKIQNNTAVTNGTIIIGSDGTITIGNGDSNGNFTNTGTGGFYCKSFTWDVSL